MVESKPNKVLKSLKASVELHREIKTESARTGVKIEDLVDRAWRAYKSSAKEPAAEEPPPHRAKAAVPLPSIFEGLDDDQIWTIQNLVGIWKDGPQGSIFRNLETALRLAITDYRMLRSQNDAPKTKAPRESAQPSHRKPTGTGRDH